MLEESKTGFYLISEYKGQDDLLPIKTTKLSADFKAAEDVVIPAFEPGTKPVMVPTGGQPPSTKVDGL